MPTELADYQHELVADDTVNGLVFGRAGTTYLTLEYPQIVPGDERFGDVDLEREDGTAMGEDYATGKSVVFEIGVDTTTAETDRHAANADALEAFEQMWKNPDFRNAAGRYAILRSRAVPGRTRRAYGRPRRYAETTSRLTHRGYSTVLCDFQSFDGKWYDDVEQTRTLAVGETTTIPLAVAGTARTWPVVTFYGPWTTPSVTIGSLTIAFKTGVVIPEGSSVTFDPRPWQRTVTRNDGASWAGKLDATTPPMRKCDLVAPDATWAGQPGDYHLAVSGTGTGRVEVRWRNAFQRW